MTSNNLPTSNDPVKDNLPTHRTSQNEDETSPRPSSDLQSDPQIEPALEAFLSGDNEALAVLYQAYREECYRFVYRYTENEQLSIDVVQDAFLRIQQYRHSYNPAKASFKTYLFQVAYHRMVERLKREDRLRKFLPFLFTSPSRPAQEEQLTEKISIREALKQLSEDKRAVILLVYYHDMSLQETAKVLNIPLGTAKSRLHYAIRQLKAMLEVE